MKRLKIGIDVDGVCGDFLSRAYDICRAFCGKPVPGAVQTSWGFDSLGINSSEIKELWKVIDSTENWWEGHAALDTTTFLSKMSRLHELYFITARQQGLGDPIEIQTANWLQMKFGILFPTVIVTHRKGPIVRALGLEYFIDDRDTNCAEVALHSSDTKVYLCDATYNQGPVPEGTTRCFGLDDFFDKIGALDSVSANRS